jgi:hypothetical protein
VAFIGSAELALGMVRRLRAQATAAGDEQETGDEEPEVSSAANGQPRTTVGCRSPPTTSPGTSRLCCRPGSCRPPRRSSARCTSASGQPESCASSSRLSETSPLVVPLALAGYLGAQVSFGRPGGVEVALGTLGAGTQLGNDLVEGLGPGLQS